MDTKVIAKMYVKRKTLKKALKSPVQMVIENFSFLNYKHI